MGVADGAHVAHDGRSGRRLAAFFFVPEKANEVFGPALAAGTPSAPRPRPAGRRGRRLVAVGENAATTCSTWTRARVARYIGGMGARGKNFYNDLACRYGYESRGDEIQDLYLTARSGEAEAASPGSGWSGPR